MFRLNSRQDRVDYGALLAPPAGYHLVQAVGTTYSLDLTALLAALVVLSGGALEHEPTPGELYNAIARTAAKVMIFAQGGQIKAPVPGDKLSRLLDTVVTQVTLPRDERGIPAFHAKMWVLVYGANGTDDSLAENRRYRLAVLSRNLTFDRSIDISLALDGESGGNTRRHSYPVEHFVRFLESLIPRHTAGIRAQRAHLERLADELRQVSFYTAEPFTDFAIMPVGIGERSADLRADVLFNDQKYSAEHSFNELVIISPFLSDGIVAEFADATRSLKDTRRVLLTRRAALAQVKPATLAPFDIYVVRDDVIDGESYLSAEGEQAKMQDIHAKMYLWRKGSKTRLYLGSLNATDSAVNRNVELLVELATGSGKLNMDKFLAAIFGGAADARECPFERVELSELTEIAEDDSEVTKKALENVLKEICALAGQARVGLDGEDYKICAELPRAEKISAQYPAVQVALAPLGYGRLAPLASEMEFTGLTLAQLTALYRVEVSGAGEKLTRVIKLPTEGIPAGRGLAIARTIFDTPEKILAQLELALGADAILAGAGDGSATGASAALTRHYVGGDGLYERLVRIAAEDSSRLDDSDYIYELLQGREDMADFVRLYETIRAARRRLK